MAKKKVCVSFDYDNDRYYYYLLKAWDKSSNFEFYFNDMTPSEINSNSVVTVKRVLSNKIGEANYMIAIVGKHSDSYHHDYKEIGYKNWQAYEIDKNREKGNGLVVVFIDACYSAPSEVYGQGAKFVYSFEQSKILQALNDLCSNR